MTGDAMPGLLRDRSFDAVSIGQLPIVPTTFLAQNILFKFYITIVTLI